MITETKRGPGRPRSLSVATEKAIARRYASGKWTLAQLAEHYQIAVGTVRAIVKRNPVQDAAASAAETTPEAAEGLGAFSDSCLIDVPIDQTVRYSI